MQLDEAIRSFVRDELRTVVREEFGPVLESIHRAAERLVSGIGSEQRNTTADGLLTVHDAAVKCRVTDATVRSWIALPSGGLRASRLGDGRGYRIRRSDLDAFLTARTRLENGAAPSSQLTRIVERVLSRSSKER
jgi:excisionase family DNA binding protein